MTVKNASIRKKVARLVESADFQSLILLLIILNAFTLGMETLSGLPLLWYKFFDLVDTAVIFVFSVEVSLKLYAYRLSFFKQGWNNFDFLIVFISLMPAMGSFSALRAFRIVRVLRVLSFIPKLRLIVNSFLSALPGVAAVSVLLLLVYYVFAIIAINLFGTEFPEYFGSLGASLFTLFQLMTLENWPDIARTVMDLYPWAWAFFIPYILCTTFTVLNMVIAIVVNVMHEEMLLSEKNKNKN